MKKALPDKRADSHTHTDTHFVESTDSLGD
jgi:hypothetical protein